MYRRYLHVDVMNERRILNILLGTAKNDLCVCDTRLAALYCRQSRPLTEDTQPPEVKTGLFYIDLRRWHRLEYRYTSSSGHLLSLQTYVRISRIVPVGSDLKRYSCAQDRIDNWPLDTRQILELLIPLHDGEYTSCMALT